MPKGLEAMFVSLGFLSQLLIVMTVCTVLITFSMLSRSIRESHFQGIILLLIVLSIGNLNAWLFHNLWLIPAVVLPPLIAGLAERSWAPCARINIACLSQNALLFLLFSASATLRSSNLLILLTSGIAWIAQFVSVLATLFATFDLLNVLQRCAEVLSLLNLALDQQTNLLRDQSFSTPL